MSDDTVVDTLSLPVFFILYNAKPVSFADTIKAAFLGLNAAKLLIPATGKISVPFYANTNSETIVVELKDNFGTVINTVTVASSTAKKIFLYNYDLSAALPLVNNTIYFILTITVGASTITKPFRYIEFPDYDIKEIAYLNKFGFYVYAYLDGQMSIDNALSGETYEQLDGTDKTIEINEDFSYSINTGSLLLSEKETMREIVNALDAKLFYNGEWLDMVNRTKKIKDYQDRLNNYSENLLFSVNRNPNIANSGLVTPGEESEAPADSSTPPVSSEATTSSEPPVSSEPPTEARITLDSVTEQPNELDPSPEGQSCINISITLQAGYTPDDVIVVLTPDGGPPQEFTMAVDFPIFLCSFDAGDYSMYIKEVDTDLMSNTVFFTIS